MRIYFSAAHPCMLRLGGAAAGACGEIAKFADIEGELLAEFLPTEGDLLPLTLLLGDAFYARPPRCCDVYRYDRGADVYAARFAPREGGLRVLAQVRAGTLLVSVFSAGGQAQAALDGKKPNLVPLPSAKTYTAETLEAGGQIFAALRCFGRAGTHLLLFNEEGDCVWNEEATDVAGGDAVTVRRLCPDIAGHTITRVLRPEGGGLREIGRTVQAREGFDLCALPAALLPFALFEELLAGGDPAPCLAPSLAEKLPLLKEYLGDFCKVTIPREIFYLTHGAVNAAGLVYRRAENLFDIRFFAADLADGKICNIRPVE